jgi:ADP-L-glycero-D-manno-heptose 6-epimerase
MKNILLTGSLGFIGKNLKERLISQDINVVQVNEDIFDEKNWRGKILNLLDKNKPEVVFHVGACSDTLETRVNYMMTLNFESTKLLMDWCEKNNAKMIYSSSAASYGTDNLNPSNLYGWSKYVAEQYVISKGGVGLRYFNVYGPKEEHKGVMASVAYQSYIKKQNGVEIKLFPKNPTRDFVYVKDVVDANLFAVENYDSVKNNWYDVGSGESRSFEDVLNLLDIPYTYHDEKMIPMGYQFYTCSDKNKFLKGWQPNYNLEKGLKEYKNYLLLSMNNII